jgi:DNA-binding transcriptional regulator YiaG
MSNNHDSVRVRPFPWKCGHCGERAVYLGQFPYASEIAYDDVTYTVSFPDLEAPRCQNCGNIVLTDAANERIDSAFRAQAGLLTPEDIRRRREALGLTQNQLVRRLGVDAATLGLWEAGSQFPSRALNHLLDLFFAFPLVRQHLEAPAVVPGHTTP